MMEYWQEDMIRFLKDASEYGTCDQDLARLMAPYLTEKTHICDAGCGLGYLSLALSPYVERVTSVDKHPKATGVLAENCRRFGITNVHPVCSEVERALSEKKYDAMVFCFFGGIREVLSIAKKQCDGKVFIITRNYTTHRFSVGKHSTGKYGYLSASGVLKELKIPFEETILDMEFGQPFRCMEDVRKFFEMYSKDQDKTAISDEFLRSKVTEREHEVFPLYMPHQRSTAILIFDTKYIPELPADWEEQE